jgi:cellulose synthase/poly-beta-1,6-N-acetylglucosamine synthase-like glycosyltransferase
MRNGARVYYEPSAVAFTAAPARLVHLARQRARWHEGWSRASAASSRLYRFQRRRVFNLLGLRVRRNTMGFVGFVVAYQMLMSPIAVVGYGQELLGLRRRWK